jgi:integrase
MRNDFTLFLRTIPGGKKVFYYYTYDQEGNRRGPWTTKTTTRTAARNFCNALFKKGEMIPDRKKTMSFGEYADGFWERDSEYIKRQESRADITDTYIHNCKRYVANQLMPFFADVPLNKITEKDVNDWLLGFKNRKVVVDGKEEIAPLQNTYANTVLGTLNVMMTEAVRRGLIQKNPCEKVQRLKNDRRKMEIFNVLEVHRLFPAKYKAVWGDKEISYAANRLASLTGMRIGEIMGLRGEFVFDNFILVCGQFGEFGYKPYTKTKENRAIPLLPEMIALLRKLMKANGKGFVFSLDGGATPVCYSYIRRDFSRALEKIGIDENEAMRRRLTLHSWRHFVNTDFLMQGMTLPQVQGVTGHKSAQTSGIYTHVDARQIADVIKAQQTIWCGKQAKAVKQPEETAKSKEKPTEIKIVKKTESRTA